MKNSSKFILLAVILSTAFSLSSRGQTPVSGGIYANTTWTLANSPYIVTDTVVVFPGVILTIEPGVIVKFNDQKQIIVRDARILAEGTPTDSITFTSNSSSPAVAIYAGINLLNSHYSKFNYCNVKYADHGIAPYYMDDTVRIKNSRFTYNRVGVGIIYHSYVFVDNCIFRYNVSGIKGFAAGSVKIKNCNTSKNQYGITSMECATVRNCVIDSNTTIGIETAQCDSVIGCTTRYNGIGMRINPTIASGGLPQYISQNIIEYNNVGIELNAPTNTIVCNKICNNTTYALKYLFSFTGNTSIPNNYWCTTDSLTVASQIYDGHDNINLQLISFMPLDTSQCYLTGCNLQVVDSVTNATCSTCHNGSATAYVLNGTAPYTYTWYTSPLQTTQTATGLAPGTYTVCVVDNNGCSICDSNIYIDSTNCNGFSISTHGVNSTCSICNDGKAWVNSFGATPPYSYSWYTSPMQNTDTAFNLLPGTYGVCVTDLYGCTLCDSVTISTGSCSAHFDLYPDANIPHQYYAVNMASGVAPISYMWNFGDGTTSNQPYPTHIYAVAGFYSICLTIADAVGCTNTYCNNYYLQKSENAMVRVNVVAPSGISEHSNNQGFSINPNPASDIITITTAQKDNATIKIINLLGELKNTTNTSQAKTDIDISQLAAGVYIIEVVTDKNSYRQKFIKE